MIGLTKKQAQCLQIIRAYVRIHGYAPSYLELAQALNVSSKSGIHRLITCLEERGYLRRLKSHARSIELIEERPSVHRIVFDELDEIKKRMPRLASRLERAMGYCNEPL